MALLLGKGVDHLADRHIGAQGAAAGRPEPGRVVLARHRRHDGVGQRAQNRAVVIGKLRGH